MSMSDKTIEKINTALEKGLCPEITIFDGDSFCIDYRVENMTLEYCYYDENTDTLLAVHIPFSHIKRMLDIIDAQTKTNKQ